MTPEQFISRAGKHAGLVKRFLIGRPVEIVSAETSEDTISGFRDGKLHLALINGALHMLAHEMAHVVEATPDELFMHNMGLGTDGGISSTPEQFTAESRVLAWHIILIGDDRLRERLSKIGEAMFGARSTLGRAGWRAALDENLATFTVEQFAERWEHAWEVIDARAAVVA